MSSTRRAALAAGILFIVADVAGVLSVVVLGSLLDGPGFLAGVSANTDRVAAAAVLESIMGLACAGIAIALYPVLRQVGSGLAMGAAGMRVIEGMVFLVAATALLALVTVSQDAASTGTIDSAAASSSSALLRAIHNQTGTVAVLPFAAGAFLYYWAFWRSGLTPRWLSGWGLVAIVLYAAVGLWAMLSRTDFNGYSALLAPLAIQEIVLAIWLLANDFRQPALRAVAV